MKRRRRRRSGSTDSLDMLLDALCNMFGGIIFIALLVAIMSGEQADQRADAAPPPPATRSLESITLQHQLDAIEAKVPDLQGEHPAAWTHLEQALADSDGVLATIERLEAIVGEIESRTPPVEIAIQQAIRALERLEQSEQTLEDAKDNPDLAAITEAIEQEEQAIIHLEQQLQAAAQRRTVNARLGYERKTNKLRLFLYVGGDRVWVVIADRNGYTFSPSDRDDRDVSFKERYVDGERTEVYTPRPRGGFPVTDAVARHARFVELIRTFSHNRYYVHLTVADDGHRSFATLKTAFLHHGYQYNVQLDDGDGAVIFHIVTHVDGVTQ